MESKRFEIFTTRTWFETRMLPVMRKLVIQYLIENLEEAGFREILIITSKNKRTIDAQLQRGPLLLEDLRRRNKYHKMKLDMIPYISVLC